jgi:omega-amidase
MLRQKVKIALIQLKTGSSKKANLAKARTKVLEAASQGAKIIVLPEIFNSPYSTSSFPQYAEPIESSQESYKALEAMAKESQSYLIGGSIPERSGDKLYNTNLSFSPDGKLIGKFRKVHLFDIDIPGKIKFRESDVLSAGEEISILDTSYGKIGIAICYDVRFPELAMIAARKGAFMMVYPGAFNTTTGPLHWSLLARARAIDNEIYVAMCSPARDMDFTYHAWGHSMLVDPMGEVVEEADETEQIVYGELDPIKIQETRKSIPVTSQRRFGVYPDVAG